MQHSLDARRPQLPQQKDDIARRKYRRGSNLKGGNDTHVPSSLCMLSTLYFFFNSILGKYYGLRPCSKCGGYMNGRDRR